MPPKNPTTNQTKRRGKRDPDSDSDYESDSSSSSSSSEIILSSKKKVQKKDKKTKTKTKSKEKFDKKEFKNMLAELFPSSFSKKKAEEANASKKKKKVIEEEEEEDDEDDEDYDPDEDESEEYDDDSDEDDDDDDDDDSDEDDDDDDDDDDPDEEEEDEDEESEESTKGKKKNPKINIILSVGTKEEDEYNEYFGHENDDDDDDEECDTDDEETFMKEKYEKIDQPSDSSVDKEEDEQKETKSKKKKEKAKEEVNTNVESEYIQLLELKKELSKQMEKNPKSKILKRAITDCSTDIRKLVKNARKNNTKEYKKLIHSDDTKPGEFEFFKTKMSNAEQRRIMSELKEVNQFISIDKPYRLALLESSIPPKLKANAMQKINMLRSMDSCDPEYFKIKHWVDNFMRIPFCKYKSLSVSMADGIEKCHEFMMNAKNILDTCVYGLDDAKLQILQMVGQWISNPQAMGTAIAIKGPPGTGKTTLVKDGISKILGREFVFIPLGGASDASFLEGHSYTYEGSIWGKIVQSLMDCQCMNPVFYFDELDKLSETPKGEEIAGILTHLTDTSQNSQFHDKYFSEMDFDLSKCLFIFSYNDEHKVNPILRDRMYRIMTNGYESKEKIVIAKQFMLPKIREQVNFQPEEIIIPEETIRYIVGAKHLTHEEAGVRNMKRCLEIIHTKLNLFRLMKPEENLFSKDIKMEVKFPMTVTSKEVDLLIKNEEKQSQSLLAMYC